MRRLLRVETADEADHYGAVGDAQTCANRLALAAIEARDTVRHHRQPSGRDAEVDRVAPLQIGGADQRMGEECQAALEDRVEGPSCPRDRKSTRLNSSH